MVEIIIKDSVEEIAALVLAVQARHAETIDEIDTRLGVKALSRPKHDTDQGA